MTHYYFARLVSVFKVAILPLSLLAIGSLNPLTAQEATLEAETTTEQAEAKPENSNAGQSDLDSAIDAKLDATDLQSLGKVIELSQSALNKGLDEGNARFARQLLGAAAFERAQKTTEQLTQSRLGARGMERLQNEIIKDLKLAIENDPKLAEAHLLMAKLYAINKKRGEAEKSLTIAIDLLDEYPIKQSEALLMRAIMLEDPEKQMEDLQRATTLFPGNIGAWQAQLQMLLAMGDEAKIADTIKAFIETGTDNLPAVQTAIEALMGIDRVDDAMKILDEKIVEYPTSASLLRLRGQGKLFNKQQAEAIVDLSAAIGMDPKDVPAYLLRSQAYLTLEEPKLDEASADVDEALQLQPGSVIGLQMRANIAAQQKRYAEAIADIQLLVRNDPTNISWLMQLTQLYQADDRPSLAIRAADQIIKLQPNDWQAFRMRGDAYLSVGQQREAIADYESALNVLPKEAEDAEYRSGLLNNLSWVLATSPKDEIRNGKRALELGLNACELTEYKEAHILSTLAAAYAETGDFEMARKWSDKAVQLGKQDDSEQVDQLQEELESYKTDKPWREVQETEEANKPVVQIEEGVEA